MTATVLDRVATPDRSLLRTAGVGGLLGGAALAGVMSVYDAMTGMGPAALLNACFAAFVFPSAGMTMADHGSMSGMGGSESAMAGSTSMDMGGHQAMPMSSQIVPSHLAVGTLLHLGMSIVMGIAFALVLAFALRAGLRALAHPLAYIAAGGAGGALLYTIMMYGVAPVLNPTIVDMTARAPFLAAHVAFGVVTAGYVYLRRVGTHAMAAAPTRRPAVTIDPA